MYHIGKTGFENLIVSDLEPKSKHCKTTMKYFDRKQKFTFGKNEMKAMTCSVLTTLFYTLNNMILF